MATLEMTALQPPFMVLQIMHGRWAVQMLKTAVELDLFSNLKSGAKTPAELANHVGADARGVELMLNALVVLKLLQKSGHDKFELNEQSRLYLVKDSELYMGGYIQDDRLDQAWANLTESVKTGDPVHTVNHDKKAEDFFPTLAEYIFPFNYGTAHLISNEINVDQMPAGARVLDIAAGSGVWSLPLAERNKGLKVDALDFPAVLAVTKKFAQKHGVADRYSYIEGNWSECKLADESYDIVCLGHILHSEGKKRSEELLKVVHRVLKKGGKVIVAEMISDDEHTKAIFPQLFALNMYLMTQEGCVFTEGELEHMLSSSGFQNVNRPKLAQWGDESPVMIGTK